MKKLVLILLLLCCCAAPAAAQPPLITGTAYMWQPHASDTNEVLLWEVVYWSDGRATHHQKGNLRLDTGDYYPYLGPGRWGQRCLPPAQVPSNYQKTIAGRRWEEFGVFSPDAREPGGVPDTGIHLRVPQRSSKTPPRSVWQPSTYVPHDSYVGTAPSKSDVPAFDTMPSITFASKDLARAEAALRLFQTAPELEPWRKKYGARAKAYRDDDFAVYPFKLEQDKRYQEAGLIAIMQQAPDANDRAKPQSIYGHFDDAQQAQAALRDRDNWNPNDPVQNPSAGNSGYEWAPEHVAFGGLLGAALLACLGGAAFLRARKSVVNP